MGGTVPWVVSSVISYQGTVVRVDGRWGWGGHSFAGYED